MKVVLLLPDNMSRPFRSMILLFFKEMVKKADFWPFTLEFHLLMGKIAKEKLLNQARNFEENRVSVVQGTALKN